MNVCADQYEEYNEQTCCADFKIEEKPYLSSPSAISFPSPTPSAPTAANSSVPTPSPSNSAAAPTSNPPPARAWSSASPSSSCRAPSLQSTFPVPPGRRPYIATDRTARPDFQSAAWPVSTRRPSLRPCSAPKLRLPREFRCYRTGVQSHAVVPRANDH